MDLGKKKKKWVHNPEENKRTLSMSQHNQILRYKVKILNPCQKVSKNLDVWHYVGKIFRHLINSSIFF